MSSKIDISTEGYTHQTDLELQFRRHTCALFKTDLLLFINVAIFSSLVSFDDDIIIFDWHTNIY